jgi:hypothetical protein
METRTGVRGGFTTSFHAGFYYTVTGLVSPLTVSSRMGTLKQALQSRCKRGSCLWSAALFRRFGNRSQGDLS